MQKGQLLGGSQGGLSIPGRTLHVQLACDTHSDLTDTQASVLTDVSKQIPEAGCMCCSVLTLRAE